MGANIKTPRMRKANQKVRDDVRRGKREKPTTCARCGKATPPNLLSSHHADHGNQTSVRWVCPKCHKAVEAAKKGGKVNQYA